MLSEAAVNSKDQRALILPRERSRTVVVVLMGLFAAALPGAEPPPGDSPSRHDRGYSYRREVLPEIPLSIHVFKVDRRRGEFAISTSMGGGNKLGMGTVSEQIKAFPPAMGTPVAAINGDFYNSESRIPGDPRDLQIQNGELISGPAGHPCFWIDAAGEPHSTNVVSRFRIGWPDGSATPFGLNEAREGKVPVLFTAAIGSSTHTEDGPEMVLEDSHQGAWLPLRAGQTLKARVREVRQSGDSPVTGDTLVLSLGSKFAAQAPKLAAGAIIEIVTETFPDLGGASTAVGGGPTLVRDGKAAQWSNQALRHPRTAVGWSKEAIYLVEVDGRQSDLSLGMTFPELSAYLVKLGCEHAMNLDGGGSATMWVMGQVMNSPSEGQERPAANSLVVVRRKTGSPPSTSGQ
jgi:hypothetical protein